MFLKLVFANYARNAFDDCFWAASENCVGDEFDTYVRGDFGNYSG